MIRNDDPQYYKDPVQAKVNKIVQERIFGKKEEETGTDDNKLTGLKLYLNTLINLLINKKEKKIKKRSLIAIWLPKAFKWWIRDTTEDLKDLIKFISLHGAMGAPVLLTILTITEVNISLVRLIRGSIWLTAITYFLGSGSAYYLLLDLNKALKDTWRTKK